MHEINDIHAQPWRNAREIGDIPGLLDACVCVCMNSQGDETFLETLASGNMDRVVSWPVQTLKSIKIDVFGASGRLAANIVGGDPHLCPENSTVAAILH